MIFKTPLIVLVFSVIAFVSGFVGSAIGLIDLPDEIQTAIITDIEASKQEENTKKITKCWKMQDTERSTCFSQVGYDFDNEELHLVFRESGKEYIYSEFSEKDWSHFWNAESLGSYYNKWIKGQYPSRKVN